MNSILVLILISGLNVKANDLGFCLENSSATAVTALVVKSVNPNIKFIEFVELKPGGDLRDMYRKGSLSEGDVLIGLNGHIILGLKAEEIANRLEKLSQEKNVIVPANLLEKNTLKIKNILIGGSTNFQSVVLESKIMTLPTVLVTEVPADSVAFKKGLRSGDKLIGQAQFLEKGMYRSWLGQKVKIRSNLKVVLADKEKATDFFLKLAPNLEQLRNSDKKLIGWSSSLRLMLIRENLLLPLLITRTWYAGLGFNLECNPFCNSATPVVKEVFSEDSSVRVGDLILEFKGSKIKTTWQVMSKVRKAEFGEEIYYRVKRGSEIRLLNSKVRWILVE